MPASDRLSRARQLRNKQQQPGGGGGAKTTATSKKATATTRSGGGRGGGRSVSSPSNNKKSINISNDDDETSVDMSAASTIACIFLLLSIGASLATSYIMIHNPGCMAGTGGTGGNAPISTPATGNIRTPATTTTTVTSGTAVAPPAPKPAPAAAQPGSKPGFPPQCTTDQKKAVMKQLPADDCYGQPYTQMCSFNRGTTRGCQDNFWVRDTYSSTSFDKYTAILVNSGCKRSIEFADIMLMGSHDEKKYGAVGGYNKFVGQSVNSCQKPISQQMANVNPSQAICITPTPTDQTDIKIGKQAIGITGDSEIKEMVSSVGRDVKKLDDIIYKEIGLTKEQPIHYLLIREDDNDILMGSLEVLDQVRYLEFDNNWKGSWGSNPQPSFSDIIQKVLLNKNFVCYWNGVDLNLWRITDCWLNHYAQQWWSRVACVNTGHADTKPLLDKMESTFQETLTKEQKYGGQ